MNTSRIQAALITILIFPVLVIGSASEPDNDDFVVIHTPGRTIKAQQGAFPLDLERGGLLILQFGAEPSDENIQDLRSLGIELVNHLEGNTYWVRSQTSNFEDLPFIQAVIRPAAADKVIPPVAHELSLKSPAEQMSLTVALFNDISYEKAREQIEVLGGRVFGDRMLIGGRILAELPADSVEALAGSELVRAVETGPREKITHNIRAARTSSIDKARNEFHLTGKGITGGIWDEGSVAWHPDLASRIIVAEKGKLSEHATHVAGTVIGNGDGRFDATGMAPEATLVSYNFRGDIPTEMASAVSEHNIAFANNSWSYANGWSYHSILKLWIWWGDYYFGHYSSESAAYDKLVHDTGLVVLFAAGNDRADKGTSEKYLDPAMGRADDTPHPADGPYRTIDITSSAKNVISVGAVTSTGKMTGFSSWGPTKDGRIKPEVVAKGTKILSTLPDGGYAKWSGTSMATPTATGGIALLMEHFNNKLGRFPSAEEVRALIAATGKDLGRKGPDYCYGFGLLDELNAAKVIASTPEHNLIIRDKVRKAKTKRTASYRFRVTSGTKLLKVALAWIDPPAQPNAMLTLVNDLDLRLYRARGIKEYQPWILNGEEPVEPATYGVNNVDNIELVEVENPLAGEWIIEVSAGRLSEGNAQKFALAVFSDREINGKVEAILSP